MSINDHHRTFTKENSLRLTRLTPEKSPKTAMGFSIFHVRPGHAAAAPAKSAAGPKTWPSQREHDIHFLWPFLLMGFRRKTHGIFMAFLWGLSWPDGLFVEKSGP